MILINEESTFDAITKKDGIHVMVFVSDWCSDCHYLMTFMHHIEALYPSLDFYEIKRETLTDTTSHYNIFGVPSFLVFKDGELINRYVNRYRKTFIEIKDFLDNTLG
jgi:thiol-disulfide isomerase/thioredoxin